MSLTWQRQTLLVISYLFRCWEGHKATVVQENKTPTMLLYIGFHRSPHKILGPPLNLGPPLDIEAPGPPLIYLVGPLAISDPLINICTGPPNTCIVLKQFNLLPPNTLF